MQSLLSPTLSSAVLLAPALRQVLQGFEFGFRRLSSDISVNLAQWQAKATKELKGKEPTEALAHHTQDVRHFWWL
jgi:hypothetical protein